MIKFKQDMFGIFNGHWENKKNILLTKPFLALTLFTKKKRFT